MCWGVCVRVYSSHLAMRGDERQPVVGAKGPSHRSIPLSSDLFVYPAHHRDWGTLFSLMQPACTAPHLFFRIWGKSDRGCAEKRGEIVDGAKGEGVPGRALIVAHLGVLLMRKKYWLYPKRGNTTPVNVSTSWILWRVIHYKLMLCGRSLLEPTQALF